MKRLFIQTERKLCLRFMKATVREGQKRETAGKLFKKLAFLASSKVSQRLSTKPLSAKYEQTLNLSIQKEFAATEYKEGDRIE